MRHYYISALGANSAILYKESDKFFLWGDNDNERTEITEVQKDAILTLTKECKNLYESGQIAGNYLRDLKRPKLTFQDIETIVNEDEDNVFWKNTAYRVIKGKHEYIIEYNGGQSYTGLYHKDGKSSYNVADFFVLPK